MKAQEKRIEVIAWWRNMNLEQQFYKTIEYNHLIEGDKTRHPHSLTGREIEIIYDEIHKP